MKKIYIQLLSAFIFYQISACAQSIHLTQKTSFTVQQGDITTLPVDVIVNAANEQLLGGAGVCGAIFNAAGWADLQKACNAYHIIHKNVRCPVGQARITPSFALGKFGIKHIIHAVGPDCRIIHNPKEQDKLLKQAYINSLALADKHQGTSIAFPFISSGIYGFPKERAAKIAVESIREYIQNHETTTHLKKVYIVLSSKSDQRLFF
jgi:O-acetyl-ADP-ribose deacetylase